MLIGQVAKETGLTKDTIRFYLRQGLIRVDTRPAGNTYYNEYSDTTVEILKEIKAARTVGFRLNELRVIIASAYDGTIQRKDIDDMLQEKLIQTRHKIRELKKVEAILVSKLANS